MYSVLRIQWWLRRHNPMQDGLNPLYVWLLDYIQSSLWKVQCLQLQGAKNPTKGHQNNIRSFLVIQYWHMWKWQRQARLLIVVVQIWYQVPSFHFPEVPSTGEFYSEACFLWEGRMTLESSQGYEQKVCSLSIKLNSWVHSNQINFACNASLDWGKV